MTTEAGKRRAAEAMRERRRCGRRAMLGVLIRMLTALTGGLVMFVVWLAAVLVGMPRPPVPPSFAVTLACAGVTAAGLAAGLLVGERVTARRRTRFGGLFLWAVAGCLIGALTMYPLGGMMAGFGILGLGPLALLIREALLLRDTQPPAPNAQP